MDCGLPLRKYLFSASVAQKFPRDAVQRKPDTNGSGYAVWPKQRSGAALWSQALFPYWLNEDLHHLDSTV